jgi:hypothetical protein
VAQNFGKEMTNRRRKNEMTKMTNWEMTNWENKKKEMTNWEMNDKWQIEKINDKLRK